MKGYFLRLIAPLGINSAIAYGAVTNIWRMVAGPITVLVIAAFFSQEVQGFYYTFGSVIALQSFIELGLGNVIVQFASHEWSQLRLDPHGDIVGDPDALSRLASLARLVFLWYLAGGVIVTLGLGLAGYLLFSQKSYPGIAWMAPWFALCFFNGIKFCIIPAWSILEGCNQVSRVYAYRLFFWIISNLAIWVSIALGTVLWSVAISVAVGLVWSVLFLIWRYKNFFRSLFLQTIHKSIPWQDEIWPFQWRIALSTIGGYFISFFFVPVLFHYHGAIVAGQMGMTWALVTVLSATSVLWTATRVPSYGMLVAGKKYQELDHIFFRTATTSILILILGALMVWLLTVALYYFDHPLAARFLPPLPTGLLLIGQVAMISTTPLSHYLRAHKREPLLWASLCSGFLIGILVWWLGSRYSAMGVASAYMLVSTFFSLPYAVIVWHRCRTAWHVDSEDFEAFEQPSAVVQEI